ncbi:MAG: single-stranded-DNA-specific exonuclease RecJ [Tissierellia bacterium]|nr:single-stranded-DNA-specific exonuclease RecJ [Tissierellia bacterium]
MVNRGIMEHGMMDSYIHPSLDKLHNPKLMRDMDLGVDMIMASIEAGKKIRIVGDYDQDGTSAIVILHRGLNRCGAYVDYAIPHRIADGYGINKRIVKEAKKDGIGLIITCDNGISAFEPIKLARELGMEVIITDHHDIPHNNLEDGDREYQFPDANAIINPKRQDCDYPFEELCGAGVALKLVQALYNKMGIDIEESYEMLEYAAMATVCDVVDLIDENRIIVKEGLERINDSDNLGMMELIRATGLGNRKIDTYSLGFILGPCINASGRLDSADIAVELFLTDDIGEARRYADKLYGLNEERKAMTAKGYERVIQRIEHDGLDTSDVLVVYEPDIHESIAGIIAGKVKDRYYRPTIVLTQSRDEGVVKGSGRSIEGYNIFAEVYKCKDLLGEFGGHPMAVGLSMNMDKVEDLSNRLNEQSDLTEEDLLPKIYIDAHLPLDYIDYKLIEELQLLEPFGRANPRPLFAERDIPVKKATVLGSNRNVLKLILSSRSGRNVEGIYFGDIERFDTRITDIFGEEEVSNMYKGIDNDIRLDLVYVPAINEYMGNRNLQIIIQNYR